MWLVATLQDSSEEDTVPSQSIRSDSAARDSEFRRGGDWASVYPSGQPAEQGGTRRKRVPHEYA